MSDEFKLKFTVELDGKEGVDEFFWSSEGAANHLQSTLNRAFKQSGAAISAFAGKAKSELQDFAGKELGGSLGSQARGVLQFRDAINKLAVSAGGGTEMVDGLKAQIQAVSVASNQLQGDVTQAMQAFVERTGDITTARKNIELYAKTATAASASLEDVARVGESLSSKFGIADQTKAFTILVTQAKAGAIEMRDLATQGASIFTAARAANIGGKGKEEEGVREIGGFLQAVAGGARGKGKTTAADTAVQVAAMFSQIRQKADRIEGIGIKVNGRDYIEVIKDLIVKSGGDSVKLAEVFKNERAFRGISTLARQYKETGNFSELDHLTNLGADPNVLNKDFATRTGTGEAKLKAMQISRAKFVDQYFGGIAEFAAAHASELQVGAVGLGLAGKGLSLLGRAGGAVGGSVGGALASATAQRVFVVNMPGGGLLGGLPGAPGGKLGGIATKLGIAGAVLGAGLYGIEKWKEAGNERIDAIENAGVEINRNKLEMRRRNKEAAVTMLERQGFDHGRAVNLADRQVQNHIKIEIHGDQATITEQNGTRSVVSLSKRNAEGG